MAIVAVLFIFFEKLRIVLVIAFIALLAAFGLEFTKNDWNLGKLWGDKVVSGIESQPGYGGKYSF